VQAMKNAASTDPQSGSQEPIKQSDQALGKPCPDNAPTWFAHEQSAPQNTNFAARVVERPSDTCWEPTHIPGISMRLLEYVPGDPPRITAQLRLESDITARELCIDHGVEMLVQRGELEMPQGMYPAGLYLRLPLNENEPVGNIGMRANKDKLFDDGFDTVEEAALVYISTGQFAESDTEQRRINTHDESRWLPGPIAGTEVLPLHGHGSDNVMLIRWTSKAAFQPRIDPAGEEVLVLRGQLHDAEGSYPAGTWIRNPVPAWQAWAGEEGTIVYYKNGHFEAPEDTAVSSEESFTKPKNLNPRAE